MIVQITILVTMYCCCIADAITVAIAVAVAVAGSNLQKFNTKIIILYIIIFQNISKILHI